MKTSLQASLPPMEVTSVDLPKRQQATCVDLAKTDAETAVERALALLRRAVTEQGYTLDALEAATGRDRSHIHRILNGEKALTIKFLSALPVDVKRRYAQLAAEAMGFIVVTPLQGQDAVKGLVGGLFGLLAKGAA